jgi:hypothetical protein
MAPPPAGAQDLATFTGKWVKTNNSTKPDQPGIGAWIEILAGKPARVVLSWAPPAVVADAQGQHGANVVWRSDATSCWYDMQRTPMKMTLRLTKSEPPGVCLEDSVFEEGARPPPPPLPKTVTIPPPATVESERPAPGAVDTVRSFYAALRDADGVRASSLVVPEKRTLKAYDAGEIAAFYGSLAEPLRVTDLVSLGGDTFRVGYTFRLGSSRRRCTAVVTVVRREGRPLIHGIKADC